VVIPAGSFTMGSPETEPGRQNSESPQRQVTFAQPFAVGRFAEINPGFCDVRHVLFEWRMRG
jgi:hypothetical protein